MKAPIMVTDITECRGKTIRGVLDGGEEGLLFVFTDGTVMGLEAIDDEWQLFPWFPERWIGDDWQITRDQAIDNGLCTAEEWDAEAARKAEVIRQQKLDEYEQLKRELGM